MSRPTRRLVLVLLAVSAYGRNIPWPTYQDEAVELLAKYLRVDTQNARRRVVQRTSVSYFAAGKGKALPLWKERPDAPCDIWLQALDDGILLDEIRISGVLPADWLRAKWSGAQ